MTQTYEIATIQDLPGLIALRSELNELSPGTETEPWQGPGWLEATATAFSEDSRPQVITLRRAGKLTAVAPMALKRSEQPLRPWRIDVLGGEELKEPSRFITSDSEELDVLATILAKEKRYPIRLSRICYDEKTLDCFLAKFKEAGWITKVMKMPYPFLDLKTYEPKKSLVQDLRRARNKASKYGELSFSSITGANEDELRRQLDLALGIEASGWKGRNGTAILANEGRKRFFEGYASSALRDGMLRLNFLSIDGNPIAMQYAVEAKNQYWLFNIGYDEEYRSCSPGNILLEESIKSACERKLDRYNFLGKEEPWTRRWTTDVHDCYIVAAYRLNFHGIRAMCSDFLYLVQKRRQESKRRESK